MDKIIPITWKIFYGAFVIAFAPGIIFIFFRSRTGTSHILLPFITVVLVLPLLINAWRLTGRIAPAISEKYHRIILSAFLALSAIIQLILGNRLRFVPMWDVEAIFDGARYWALTGSLDNPTFFHITYERYFAMFQNQWGSVFLFRMLFSVYDFFGGSDFHWPALVWNVAMVQVMAVALYSAANRLKGRRAGLYVLFLLTVFLPFHFFGAVYYTDTLSMPFAAIAFSLYLRAKDEDSPLKKLLLFMACALAVAVGAAIKFNLITVFIAILIDFLLTKEKGLQLRLYCAAAAVAAVVIILGSLNLYMNRLIGPEMTDRHRIPRTHWMMMGLNHYGRYSWDDFQFTMNIPDLATRQRETTRVFFERLRGHGISGMSRIYASKFSINFGDGTYEMHRILHQDPVNHTRLHNMVLAHGRHYATYKHIATGITTALLILMLAGALHAFWNFGSTRFTAVPWLAFFGLVLLLTVWESGGRLTMNHFPLLVVGGVIGLSIVEQMIQGLSRYSVERENSGGCGGGHWPSVTQCGRALHDHTGTADSHCHRAVHPRARKSFKR